MQRKQLSPESTRFMTPGTPTVVPPSYPALESEVYRSFDDADTDRPTLIPSASEQAELAAESRRS